MGDDCGDQVHPAVIPYFVLCSYFIMISMIFMIHNIILTCSIISNIIRMSNDYPKYVQRWHGFPLWSTPLPDLVF